MTGLAHLALSDFRSYADLALPVDAPLIALAGENGAGKTNILEAISLLSPGRGLRRAEFADMARSGAGGAVSRVELFVMGRLMKAGASVPAESWIDAVVVVASHALGVYVSATTAPLLT